MSEELRFRWGYKEQPPMDEIAKAVAALSGCAVMLTMPFTGPDEHELVVARGNGERPVLFAQWLRAMQPTRPDHEIAEAWRYASLDEVTFWRSLDALPPTEGGSDL